MNIFIPVILFYGNKNVCVVFGWWFFIRIVTFKNYCQYEKVL